MDETIDDKVRKLDIIELEKEGTKSRRLTCAGVASPLRRSMCAVSASYSMAMRVSVSPGSTLCITYLAWMRRELEKESEETRVQKYGWENGDVSDNASHSQSI